MTHQDDGYTGTDFNRPAFLRLKNDIEAGRVNLVLTKDLSRLGRDYIDTGYYVEKYFPQMNVRFIAVNDGVDTMAECAGNDMTGFKSVINDMYAKDISRKVTSALRSKAERGEFIGSVPPYGYKRDPADKHKLVPNEETAPIVARIFAQYISGSGYVFIAKRLNEDGIKPPAVYNKERYNISNSNLSRGFGTWGCDIIRKIIKNPVYIGEMVQHKTAVVSYKVHKQRPVSGENRLIVKNTHEAIISAEDYKAAQAVLAAKTSYSPGESRAEHALAGLIYCAKCGARMTFSKSFHGGRKGEFYVICARYKRYSGCERVTIYEKDLNETVLTDLRGLAGRISDKAALTKGIGYTAVPHEIEVSQAEERERFTAFHGADEPHISWNRYTDAASGGGNYAAIELAGIDKRLRELTRIMKNLYEDKVLRVLDERSFMEFSHTFNDERETLEKRAAVLRGEAYEADIKKKAAADFEAALNRVLDFEVITKPLAIALIDRVIIDKGGIEIVYNFSQRI